MKKPGSHSAHDHAREGAYWGAVAWALSALCLVWSWWQLRWVGTFVDEADLVVYGRLLNRGWQLYGDVFSQHGPLEDMVAQGVAALGGMNSLPALRLAVLGIWLLSSVAVAFSPLNGHWRRGAWAAAAWCLACAWVLPRWQGNLLLSHGLWAACIVCVSMLSLWPAAAGCELKRGQLFLAGLFLALALAATPIAVVPAALGGVIFWLARPRTDQGPSWAYAIAGLGAAAALLFLWMLVFADLHQAWAQVVGFNLHWRTDQGGEPGAVSGIGGYLIQDTLSLLRGHERTEWGVLLAYLAVPALAWGRRDLPLWRRGALLLALLFFIPSLRLRGGAFHAIAWVGVGLLAWCAWIGFVDRGRGWIMALLAVAILSGAIARGWRDLRPAFGQAGLTTASQQAAMAAAAHVKANSPPDSRHVAVPGGSFFYWFAERDPAIPWVGLYPGHVQWQETDGRAYNLCDAIRRNKPLFIFDQTDEAGAWGQGQPWSHFEPPCLPKLLRESYEPVPGVAELWTLRILDTR